MSICKSRSNSWISNFGSVRLVLSPSDKCHFFLVDFNLKKDVLKLAKPAALISQFEVLLFKNKLSNFGNYLIDLKEQPKYY